MSTVLQSKSSIVPLKVNCAESLLSSAISMSSADVVCDILLRFLIVCQNDCGLLTSGSTERTKAAFQLSHQAEFVIACIKRQIDCYNAIVWVESFSIS